MNEATQPANLNELFVFQSNEWLGENHAKKLIRLFIKTPYHLPDVLLVIIDFQEPP